MTRFGPSDDTRPRKKVDCRVNDVETDRHRLRMRRPTTGEPGGRVSRETGGPAGTQVRTYSAGLLCAVWVAAHADQGIRGGCDQCVQCVRPRAKRCTDYSLSENFVQSVRFERMRCTNCSASGATPACIPQRLGAARLLARAAP